MPSLPVYPPPLSASETAFNLASLSLPSPVRADGRSLTQNRPVSISLGVIPQANGSARVRRERGEEVVVGVRLEVGPREHGTKKMEAGGRDDLKVEVEW